MSLYPLSYTMKKFKLRYVFVWVVCMSRCMKRDTKHNISAIYVVSAYLSTFFREGRGVIISQNIYAIDMIFCSLLFCETA
jgi:hypothetical protein